MTLGLNKYRIVVLIGIAIFYLPIPRVNAQAISFSNTSTPSQIKKSQTYEMIKREVTTTFLSSKKYESIASEIRMLKQKNKNSIPILINYEVGDTRDFFVRDVRRTQSWVMTNSTLAYKSEEVNVWVETDAFGLLTNDTRFAEFLAVMESFLYEKTSSSSINSELGILGILEKYAGDFPNIDGDGVLDIILLDIKDEFEDTGSFVAGFFDPVNLIDHEYSNRADIIYLDLFPTLFHQDEIFTERTLSTLVHEAQHLIHAGYEGNQTETVFANEGFSEAIEIVSGFSPRSSSGYIQSPLRTLTSWNYQNPIPDYSRASLWTHYLIEQFGPEILRKLIQNPRTGVEAYSEEIEFSSSLNFEKVFQNWGIAMAVNDRSLGNEYGYVHSGRKEFTLEPIHSSNSLPDIINGSLPHLTHSLISYPLSTEITLEKGTTMEDFFEMSSFSFYPSEVGITDISTNLNTGDRIIASDYNHSSISVLLSSNTKTEVDTSLSTINLKVDGIKSGVQQKWRYGDGINDTFYLNASYLTLDSPNQKLGIIFPPNDGGVWLESISVKNVFLSELIGTGVDGDEERDFELEVYSFKNGKIDQALIPKQHLTMQREVGKLVKEEFSLRSFYDQLSSLKDSILIVLGNDEDDQNYIAIGMDKSEESSSLYYAKGIWEALSDKEIGGNTLQGWNPMMEANVVINQSNIIELESISSIHYDFEKVEVLVNPEFEHDTASVSLAVKLPDGSFETGDIKTKTPEGYLFIVPVQVDGIYQFTASFNSGDGEQGYLSNKEWSIEIPGGFLVSNNYPNPFNPSTNVPFTLLERGEVSWQVFDVLGRSVMKISAKNFESGEHTQLFNFHGLASGLYIVRANLKRERNNRTIYKTKKVMLIK